MMVNAKTPLPSSALPSESESDKGIVPSAKPSVRVCTSISSVGSAEKRALRSFQMSTVSPCPVTGETVILEKIHKRWRKKGRTFIDCIPWDLSALRCSVILSAPRPLPLCQENAQAHDYASKPSGRKMSPEGPSEKKEYLLDCPSTVGVNIVPVVICAE